MIFEQANQLLIVLKSFSEKNPHYALVLCILSCL